MYTNSALKATSSRLDNNEPTGQIKSILPSLYLTHPLPSGGKPASSIRWQPFTDVLGIGKPFIAQLFIAFPSNRF